MKTVNTTRFSVAASQAVKSPLSDILGTEILELDINSNIRTGSFSKAVSKRIDVYAALRCAVELSQTGCKSDLLVAPVSVYRRHGWQVFERRIHTGQRKCASYGSWMPKTGFGSGRIFIM